MDLAFVPARFLAWPAGALLGVEGDTPRERARNLRVELELQGEDGIDLGLRHVARSVLWFVTLPVVFLAAAMVEILLQAAGLNESVGALLLWGLMFFTLGMAGVHTTKIVVLHSDWISRRWDPRSRIWRFALLNQGPDIVVALTFAILVVGADL